ncbi:MAG: hypothetical protein K0R09_1146 [Clostridiales bacterium]|jgi:uncharacterized protein (DUF362 family)|nr:hypothetical protein [Clostridiales bacterium]
MSKVILQECKSYGLSEVTNKINSGIEKLGGWNQFVKPGDIVLLKINLIGPKSSDSASITHCEFTRELVRILKGQGCTVWIGDSSGGAIAGMAPTTQSFKVSGYEKMAEEEGAEIKNFDREGVVEASCESRPGEKMFIAKPIFDADVVINLPKLKTHSAAIYTGAVKNVFGCIPGLRKAFYHKTAPDQAAFSQIISDIHRAGRFHLHIMDGITAMQGEGPTAGEPYNANKILISKDPVALDAVGAKMLNMSVDRVPILLTAQRRGIGEGNLDRIVLDGDYNTIPRLEGFKLPKKFRSNISKNSKAVTKVVDFFKARPTVNTKKCRKCNMCVESCPVQAINRETKKINYELCIECMCCHELCMFKAVELKSNNIVAGVITGLYNRKK